MVTGDNLESTDIAEKKEKFNTLRNKRNLNVALPETTGSQQ
jgi:hypothetical protein